MSLASGIEMSTILRAMQRSFAAAPTSLERPRRNGNRLCRPARCIYRQQRAQDLPSGWPAAVRSRGPHDAPEAEMRDRGVDRLRHAGGGAIAAAVVGGAQMRAALGHLARNLDVPHARIAARLARPAARVLGRAAGAIDRPVVLVPV